MDRAADAPTRPPSLPLNLPASLSAEIGPLPAQSGIGIPPSLRA